MNDNNPAPGNDTGLFDPEIAHATIFCLRDFILTAYQSLQGGHPDRAKSALADAEAVETQVLAREVNQKEGGVGW
jgi:hypothetical protein